MLLALAVLLASTQAEWKRQVFVPGFSVEAPVKVKKFVEHGDGVSAPKGLRMWMGKAHNRVYTASINDARTAERGMSELRSFASGMAGGGGGRIMTRREITLQGQKGLDVVYENRLMGGRFRTFILGDKIYYASAVWQLPNVQPKDCERYLNSLRIPAPAANARKK